MKPGFDDHHAGVGDGAAAGCANAAWGGDGQHAGVGQAGAVVGCAAADTELEGARTPFQDSAVFQGATAVQLHRAVQRGHCGEPRGAAVGLHAAGKVGRAGGGQRAGAGDGAAGLRHCAIAAGVDAAALHAAGGEPETVVERSAAGGGQVQRAAVHLGV